MELAYCVEIRLAMRSVLVKFRAREGRLARGDASSLHAIYSLPHVTPHSLTALLRGERVPRASVRAKTSFVSVPQMTGDTMR